MEEYQAVQGTGLSPLQVVLGIKPDRETTAAHCSLVAENSSMVPLEGRSTESFDTWLQAGATAVLAGCRMHHCTNCKRMLSRTARECPFCNVKSCPSLKSEPAGYLIFECSLESNILCVYIAELAVMNKFENSLIAVDAALLGAFVGYVRKQCGKALCFYTALESEDRMHQLLGGFNFHAEPTRTPEEYLFTLPIFP